MVELAGRYSNPKMQQVLEALLSLKPSEDMDLLRKGIKRAKQEQRRLKADEVAQLVHEYVAGTSMRVLAEQWKISRHTVSARIRRDGVPRRF